MGHRAKQITFIPAELAREVKQPYRGRFAASRRGQDLAPLPQYGRQWLMRHPWGALRTLIGEPDRRGPIWAVTMVRNEEHRIAGSVRQLLDGGVDCVVVADNLSSDGTGDVLADLMHDHPVIMVKDGEQAHYQGQKMSLLARAVSRCGASWIVPFDADELWYGIGEPLAQRLRSVTGDAASAPMYDFLPAPGDVDTTDPYHDLARRTLRPVTSKTAFRAHLLATIASGNHYALHPARVDRGALAIRHYPFLGFEHFIEKALQGATALGATDLPENIGAHWREWAAASDADRVALWNDLVGRDTCIDPLPTTPWLPSGHFAQP